jgi:hypothetical protein
VINKLNLYFEKYFIFDSYSCRVWKWTLFWIKRVEKFIRSCSQNYTKDCYVLKLDIQWFFMSINKDILYKKLKEFIFCSEWLQSFTTELIIWLVEKIIYNDPTKNCIIKWSSLDWQGLPKSKSLFFTNGNTGLPIWNLTSQIFANFYLDKLDKFIKQKLKIKYYGRYVDDMMLVHKDNEYLKYCKKEINLFLINELKLTLHPDKIYLQHYSKWVLFLWSYIKPYRNYLRNKTKWNIFQKIQVLNNVITENKWKMNDNISQNFRQTINSYLWLIKWNNSYKLRKKILLNQVLVYFLYYIQGNHPAGIFNHICHITHCILLAAISWDFFTHLFTESWIAFSRANFCSGVNQGINTFVSNSTFSAFISQLKVITSQLISDSIRVFSNSFFIFIASCCSLSNSHALEKSIII